MGNQNSLSSDQRNSVGDEKLLRRNMRSAFPHLTSTASQVISNYNPSISTTNTTTDPHLLSDSEAQRQARSRSLEPRCTQEIRAIEHSKSARYGRNHHKKNAINAVPAAQLWNPEEQRLEFLKQQLQHPRINTSSDDDSGDGDKKVSLGQLKDEEFRKQLRTLVIMNNDKRRDSLDTMDNNVTEQEQLHRSITGLSTHQTQILQKIWTRATESDVMDCTRNIFAHLLRSNIRMYQFFRLTGMTDKEILGSATFARQSANFAMVFDYVITNMCDLEKVCFALQCLGERHTRLAYTIENNHWLLFARVFEDNPPKLVFQNAEGHSVWKTMVSFIIQQMRIGYDRIPSAESDADTHRLGVGGETDEKTRPKSAQSQRENSTDCGGGRRELPNRQQFASQRRHPTRASQTTKSRRAANNASTKRIFSTTTSCI